MTTIQKLDIIEILEILIGVVVSMDSATTITTRLNDYMKQEGLSLSQFAQKIGLNIGTLSYILNGNRTLSIEQLDLITECMGLAKGYFYNQYFEEVLVESTPNWRRIKPFIYGCAEIGNWDLIHKAVQLLLDTLVYSSHLFDVAEDFYKSGKKEAAIILYENVALSERNQHSERLALCQYRLFICKLGNDQEKNYQAAIQFELFVDRLDEYDQLEALKNLANTYRSLRRWDKVEETAEKLKNKAEILYQRTTKYNHQDYKLTTPLFTYIAYSNLLLGSVFEIKKDYERAMQYISLYANLDWVREDDKDTLIWKEKFYAWAKMNTMVTKFSAGDFSVLPEYIQYLESNKDERLLSLLNIIEAANRYHYNVDSILERFDISSIVKSEYSNDVYTKQTIEERLARLYFELADYYLSKGLYKNGFKYLVDSLNKSASINEKTCIIKCVGLFESLREKCDKALIEAYQKLITEVYNNEKKTGSTIYV